MPGDHKLYRAALVFASLVYLAARLWDLTASCLWFDEIFSIHAAEHPWKSLLSFVALDLIHPPLFYALLKLWIIVGGDSLLWLRLLPVTLSVIALFPLIGLCRELKLGGWTQVLALFLLAINGSMIKYAQEVRMYSLLMCVSLFSMWLFARYFVRGKSFLPLIIVNVLLVYSHYFGWFIVLAEVAAVASFQRVKLRQIVSMLAITLIGFLPWLAAVWHASGTGSGLAQNIGWMSRPGIQAIAALFLGLIEPFYFQMSSADPASVYKVSVPLLLIVLVAAGIRLAGWRKLNELDCRNTGLLLLFVLVPVVIAFTASWLMPYSVWGTRHLTIVFAPFYILVAILLTSTSPKWLSAAAVTSVLVLAGYGFVMRAARDTPQYSWCLWEPLTAAALNAEVKAPVYVLEDLVGYHVWFATRKGNGLPVTKLSGINGVAEDKAYFLPRGFAEVRSVDIDDLDQSRLWITFRDEAILDSEPPLRDLLVRGYRIIDRRTASAKGEEAAIILLEK